MGVPIRITHDLDKLPVFLTRLNERAVKRAVARSIERTLTGVGKAVTKTIGKERLVNTRELPIGVIKKRFLGTRKRVDRSLPIGDMYGAMDITDARPSLRYFFAKRIPAGTNVLGRELFSTQVRVMGKEHIVNGGFIPDSSAREWPVFKRTSPKRLPVRKLFGPSFATMLTKMKLIDGLQRLAQERYAREIASNLDHFMKSEGKK
jgi:hypothetical protein